MLCQAKPNSKFFDSNFHTVSEGGFIFEVDCFTKARHDFSKKIVIARSGATKQSPTKLRTSK